LNIFGTSQSPVPEIQVEKHPQLPKQECTEQMRSMGQFVHANSQPLTGCRLRMLSDKQGRGPVQSLRQWQ
jgi:hypothetical protein